ncbi:hypothetical protein QR680_001531 [Steinernema hermaphroditum]|uniref:Uncharacterized protein n=1 Tax=Steinernema hermaphroditum TaxID=289476 RepID=A0AA39H0Q1_9BILA|nr:hypothetical protein QR680_001531 [Steinernema hermaphroditum]
MEIEQNEVEKHSNGSEISEWDDMSINEKDGCTIRLVPPIEITSTSPVPSMVELNGHTQENGDMSDVTDNGVNSALPPLTATSTPTESISGLPAKRPTSLRTMSERRPARTLRRHGTEPNFRKGRPGLNPVRSDILNHYYLRVPAGSGRTSPSVISMQSDPESCLDGYPNDEDTDDMMGESLSATFGQQFAFVHLSCK